MRIDFEPALKRRQRIKARLIRFVTRTSYLPGPVLTMSYDTELFGKHFSAALQQGMREMEHWSVGEVEIFAAFVSKENSCAY